ncbi:MAG: DUF58 domain-containing protein [Verrucomicrobiota bacterium]
MKKTSPPHPQSSPHTSLDALVRLQFDARNFSLLPNQPVQSLLSGKHASRLRGRGLAFEELRDYRPGDDIRTMDWRATARLRKAHVRVYSEERERPTLLVVDQRTNMFFGSIRTTKATAAAELAALGAWRVLHSGDRVGAIIFGDHEIVEIRPHRSRKNVLRICHELTRLNQALPSDRTPTVSLNDALRAAARLAHHDHLVILATDYNGDNDQTHRIVTRIAAHNDVLAALVYDPLGFELQGTPGMEATDGRNRIPVDTNIAFKERFRKVFDQRIAQLKTNLRSLRIPILPICTEESVARQVRTALGQQLRR